MLAERGGAMSRANFYQAELIERVDFSKDLAMFKFKVDWSFSFRPGQYATLALEDGDKLIQRPYSIVSSPEEPFLEFFIELVPEGELTPRLWDLKVGSKVFVRNRIVGAFTLDEKSGMKRHLMAATVTGAAPYISMIRTQRIALERGKKDPHQMALIHGASRSWELGIYKDELSEVARDGWLIYVPTVSRPWEDTQWQGETGRVEDVLRKYSDQLGFNYTNCVAYACGHPQMIENAKGILTRARFPKERLKEEKYFTIKD
jgi:ferredoxin--NADP+ reductase